jgi:hypothetical protein
MKRSPVLILGAAALLATFSAVGVGWNKYFRTPPVNTLPLPAQLISSESPAGQELIAGSDYVADYGSLVANFVGQARNAYCGVASAVVVINSMGEEQGRVDQSTFFTDTARAVKSPWHVSVLGMSLNELGQLLRAHGTGTTIIHASDTDLDEFRRTARKNLKTPGDFILVNYQRAELGQSEGGHISPLAAYDPATDSFLILDVAPHKYPPVWAPASALWNAMNAPLNPSTQTTRGFLIVHDAPST